MYTICDSFLDFLEQVKSLDTLSRTLASFDFIHSQSYEINH